MRAVLNKVVPSDVRARQFQPDWREVAVASEKAFVSTDEARNAISLGSSVYL